MSNAANHLCESIINAQEICARTDVFYLRRQAERIGITWEEALNRMNSNGLMLVDGNIQRQKTIDNSPRTS